MDLIDRDKAIDEMYCLNPTEEYVFIDAIVDVLENLPSAEPGHIRCGLTGIAGDYLVRIQDVIAITEDTGALETMRRVKELKPFVQPKRKTGKWIKDEVGTVVCSICKRPRRDNRVDHIAFCNACGAKMEDDVDV